MMIAQSEAKNRHADQKVVMRGNARKYSNG
jgi:hypothetical protein